MLSSCLPRILLTAPFILFATVFKADSIMQNTIKWLSIYYCAYPIKTENSLSVFECDCICFDYELIDLKIEKRHI